MREEGPLPGVKGQPYTQFLSGAILPGIELVVGLPRTLHRVL